MLFQVVENLGLDDVLAKHGQVLALRQPFDTQVGPCVLGSGLLSELGDGQQLLRLHPHSGHRAEADNLLLGCALQAHHTHSVLVVDVEELARAGQVNIRTIQVIAQHQQEGLVAHELPRAVHRLAKALLSSLSNKAHPSSQLHKTPGVLLKMAGQLVVVLNGYLHAEERAEGLQISGLDDDAYLLNPGAQCLLHDEQDGGLSDAIPVHDREQFLLSGLGGGEKAGSEARRRDDRLAHPAASADGELQAGHLQVAPNDLDYFGLIRLTAGHELRCPIPLGTHPLTAPDVLLQRFVGQHPVQHRRCQLRGASRGGVVIEQTLCLRHQFPHALGIPSNQRLPRLVHDTFINLSQVQLHAPFQVCLGKGITAVQPIEDLHRVLLGAEVHNNQEHVLPHPQLSHIQAVTIELHEHRAIAKSTALVHPPAAGGGHDLSLVSQFHFATGGHFEIIHPIEGPGGEHAYGRTGGEPLLYGQIGPVVVNAQPSHVVVGEHLISHACDVAEVAPLLGLRQQRAGGHKDLVRAQLLTLRCH